MPQQPNTPQLPQKLRKRVCDILERLYCDAQYDVEAGRPNTPGVPVIVAMQSIERELAEEAKQ